MNPLRLVASSALFVLAGAALAVGPVGAWTGRFLPKTPTLSPSAPAAAKARLAADLAMIKSGRMHLVMKPDGTYTMHIVGLPMLGKADSVGTWKQSGAVVEMLETGAKKGVPPLRLAYAERKMTLQLGPNTRFEFTR